MVSQARASLRSAQGSALAPTLAVSLHDVAPATWPACQRVLAAIDAVAVRAAVRVPVALLVVPRFRGVDSARDAQFIGAVEARLAQGDEAVLHGWTHVDDQPLRRPFDLLRRRVYTAGEGEFAALDRMEALRRVHAGVGWFAARGWPLRGFVAPAWLMSRGARAALADTPLAYAGTRRELLLLAAGDRLFAPSMCWSTRSAWRRALSSPVNALLAGLNVRRPLLRLALHPHDADHPRVLRSWQAALLAALASRRACTEGEVADRWIGSDWNAVDTETLEDIEEPLAASVDTTPTLAEAVSAQLPTVSEEGQTSSVLRPA
jgi:predicted deacetylase